MFVTVTATVVIARSPADVWDYTQDYAHRLEWDDALISAEVLVTSPAPRVRVRARGGLACDFEYKLFDRPHRTSLAMTHVHSLLFDGGGGSWSYEAVAGGTRWTQTNSLRFRRAWVGALLALPTRISLTRSTLRSMRRAKQRLEARA